MCTNWLGGCYRKPDPGRSTTFYVVLLVRAPKVLLQILMRQQLSAWAEPRTCLFCTANCWVYLQASGSSQA